MLINGTDGFACTGSYRTMEDALVFLAQAGGDTDTNAAVAGALLGARYGEAELPPRWVDQITGAQGIAQLAERLVTAT